MRFTITTQHRDFFTLRQFLELEQLLTPDKVSSLQAEIDRLLAHHSKQMIENRAPKELLLYGRNLSSPTIDLVASDRSLANLMAQLTGTQKIRLAYTQAIRTTTTPGVIFPHPSPLEAVSCFQSLVGALLIRLLPDPHPPEFLPHTVGSGLFLSPHYAIPWAELTQTPHQSFFLIAYGSDRTVYVLEKNDPHTHALKKEGYAFGDKLKTPLLVQ